VVEEGEEGEGGAAEDRGAIPSVKKAF
jgi:hypothetical protein